MRRLVKFFLDRRGSVPVEYGLIAVLVSVALLVSVGGFSNGFQNTYDHLSEKMSGQ